MAVGLDSTSCKNPDCCHDERYHPRGLGPNSDDPIRPCTIAGCPCPQLVEHFTSTYRFGNLDRVTGQPATVYTPPEDLVPAPPPPPTIAAVQERVVEVLMQHSLYEVRDGGPKVWVCLCGIETADPRGLLEHQAACIAVAVLDPTRPMLVAALMAEVRADELRRAASVHPRHAERHGHPG